jgi:hypothetical protein
MIENWLFQAAAITNIDVFFVTGMPTLEHCPWRQQTIQFVGSMNAV